MSHVCAGVHAEHDAINRLKPLERNKALKPIHLLVIRVSKNNKLQNSKPCVNCVQTMRTVPEKKGYRIKHVYYSNDRGEIIQSSVNNLEKEIPHYSRYYRNKNGHTNKN